MAALKQIDMAALKIPRTVQRHRGLPTLHILRSGLGAWTFGLKMAPETPETLVARSSRQKSKKA
jgi:hypothetical protein